MGKRDLQKRIDNESPVMSGEMVAVASVTQVQHLTIMGPYSGDFQIVDNGRLIVGQDPDIGNRGIISPYGIFGYNSSGVNVFSVWFKPAQNGGWTSGDVHAGNLAANYMLYDQSEGTFGLYTAAGAGVLLDNDGSARFGHSDGGNMLWDSASESLKIRSGAVVVSEIDSLGNASFTGVMTATGGRITGDMQVDARLRAGDVDGPAVYVGKLVDEDGAAYAGQILVTDTENVPWFNVRTGSDGTGYLHVGRPGDYPNRLTLEVTPTAATLTFDGTAYIAAGEIAGWTITAEKLTAPTGYVALHGTDGVVITSADYGGSASSDTGAASGVDKMITYRDASGNILHRIEAYSDTADGQPREVLTMTTNPIDSGRAYLSLRAVAEGEAWARLRAIGGYGLAGQQDASVQIFAYRKEGDWNHSRIVLDADTFTVAPYDGASAPAQTTGSIPNGMVVYSDGTWDPGAGAGIYFRVASRWHPVALHAGAWDVVEYADSPFTAGDVDLLPVDASGGNVTINLPQATTKPDHQQYIVKKTDSSANTVTIDAYSTATIDGALTYVLTAQWQSVWLRRQGADWRVVATV